MKSKSIIGKQHLMRRREQYVTDPYLQALNSEHLKVIQHSRIGMDRDGNIVCDTIGQQLLDKIEVLRANHIESNYPECLI
jgi:hypothetical protein